MCIPDLVIIKYFGNNTIEIKRIIFTYPDLLPSAFVVELELIHVYLTVCIHLLWKSCDVRPVSMARLSDDRNMAVFRNAEIHLNNWTKSKERRLYQCAHNQRLSRNYTGDNRNSEMPNTQSKFSNNWNEPVKREDLE